MKKVYHDFKKKKKKKKNMEQIIYQQIQRIQILQDKWREMFI